MALRIRLLEIAENIRGSYWFIPTVMALGGSLAGAGLILLDAKLGDDWLGRFEWFYGSRPEGARSVLSTIASSTITVAGVVFSVTLAAVTYASGQYGPRLLTNFQRDRGNQVTLGTFIATYLYCLIVLRTIRSPENTGFLEQMGEAETFVPHLAIYGALVLALASIAVLIYFVHHVTDSIHINNVIARIGQSLIDDIRTRPADKETEAIEAPPELKDPLPIRAVKAGYIEAVDRNALVTLACKHDLVLEMARHPGDFVHQGDVLLHASPAASLGASVGEQSISAFAFGEKRTPLQDLRFAIDELVELAARALSPGVNDPFTAIACIDWLGAVMAELQQYGDGGFRIMRDPQGRVRLIFEMLCFDDYLQAAFGQLRPYVAADPNARTKLVQVLDTLIDDAPPDYRLALYAERRRLVESFRD